MAIGMAIGSIIPGAGTLAGMVLGLAVGNFVSKVYEDITEEANIFNGKSMKETHKNSARKVADFLTWWN